MFIVIIVYCCIARLNEKMVIYRDTNRFEFLKGFPLFGGNFDVKISLLDSIMIFLSDFIVEQGDGFSLFFCVVPQNGFRIRNGMVYTRMDVDRIIIREMA